MNNIQYEIHSGCGARQLIESRSLRAAKCLATKLGYGVRTPVWIRDHNGRLLARKDSKTDSLWVNR